MDGNFSIFNLNAVPRQPTHLPIRIEQLIQVDVANILPHIQSGYVCRPYVSLLSRPLWTAHAGDASFLK